MNQLNTPSPQVRTVSAKRFSTVSTKVMSAGARNGALKLRAGRRLALRDIAHGSTFWAAVRNAGIL